VTVGHDSCTDSRSTECFPFDETRAPPTREIQCVSSPDAHFCPAVLTVQDTCAHHRNINRNQTRRYSIRKGNCSIAWHCTFHTHSIYFIGDGEFNGIYPISSGVVVSAKRWVGKKFCS